MPDFVFLAYPFSFDFALGALVEDFPVSAVLACWVSNAFFTLCFILHHYILQAGVGFGILLSPILVQFLLQSILNWFSCDLILPKRYVLWTTCAIIGACGLCMSLMPVAALCCLAVTATGVCGFTFSVYEHICRVGLISYCDPGTRKLLLET